MIFIKECMIYKIFYFNIFSTTELHIDSQFPDLLQNIMYFIH